MSSKRNSLVLVASLLSVSCGAPQHGPPPPQQALAESRALEVIDEGFQEVGVQPELHRRIHLPHDREMEIDVATAGHPHGVEYITEQDRVDFGDALPQRRDPNALLTVVGVGDDSNTDVLLLDDHDFMYQPDPSATGPGQPTLVEVEDRLRRNVVDYLSYLQHHGQL